MPAIAWARILCERSMPRCRSGASDATCSSAWGLFDEQLTPNQDDESTTPASGPAGP